MDLRALDVCRGLLKPVPLPAVAPDDDARAAFVRDEAALITANGRLAGGNKCVARVRAIYAGGK